MVESGYDQFVTASINFIVAPPALHLPSGSSSAKQWPAALASAEVAQAFSKIGALARPGSPRSLLPYLTQQQLLWARNVEATRISVD
jgi:tripartite-type tricarboxylate transporter receptor subunit TctC